MTTLHATNVANVEGSLNNWFVTQLAAFSKPSYFTSYATYFYWPENELTYPSFSFSHIPVLSRQRWQGNVETASSSAVESHGLLEINCWVNREQLNSGQEIWIPILQTMQGFVEQVYNQSSQIVIQDYVNPSNPVATTYLVRLGDLTKPVLLPDANPAIKRRRLLIDYWWILRA
jgi:hypothetical protein